MMPTSGGECIDHDRDSLYSGSDSNTDSGRGCSEEGEASVGALSQSKSVQSFASSRTAQVVPVHHPNPSLCYSPNTSNTMESPYNSSHDWSSNEIPNHHISDGTSPKLNTAFTGHCKPRYKSGGDDPGTMPGYHRYGLPLDTVSEDGGSTTSGSYVVDDDDDERRIDRRPPPKRKSADAEEICRDIEMLCNYKPYSRGNNDSMV